MTDCVRILVAGQGDEASSFVSGSLPATKFGHPLDYYNGNINTRYFYSYSTFQGEGGQGLPK